MPRCHAVSRLLSAAALAALSSVHGFTPNAAKAQAAVDPQQLSIGVITFGRGDGVHQYFGHNAFLVSAPNLDGPTVFNYGMFTFGPDMIPNFLRGRLLFWMGATALQPTARAYASHNRDVRVRDLNLEPEVRAEIFKQLQHDARPENREYLYDHYFDNCSTRLRDVLDRALAGQLRSSWSAPARFTLRQETRRYTQHDVFTEWMMMFGLNSSVDRPQTLWGDAFLPDQFEHMLDTTFYRNSRGDRVPLVSGKRDLFLAQRPPVPDAPATRWPFTLAIGVTLGVVAFALGRQYGRSRRAIWRFGFATFSALYGLVAGLIGTLLTQLWLLSDHVVSHRNVNLLLVNPLTLVAGVLAVAIAWRSARVERWLYWLWTGLGFSTLLLLALHVSSLALQDVTLTVTLLAPINLGLAAAHRRSWLAAHAPIATESPMRIGSPQPDKTLT